EVHEVAARALRRRTDGHVDQARRLDAVTEVPPRLREARAELEALVAEVRPELHRFCARMTGSVMDGEDLVQETLMRAFYVLPTLETVPPLRPWLFRIAKNRALDLLKSYERRMRADAEPESLAADGDPEDTVARAEAERAAVSRFVALPAAQRSAAILKDVLDVPLDEIADTHETSVPAAKPRRPPHRAIG